MASLGASWLPLEMGPPNEVFIDMARHNRHRRAYLYMESLARDVHGEHVFLLHCRPITFTTRSL